MINDNQTQIRNKLNRQKVEQKSEIEKIQNKQNNIILPPEFEDFTIINQFEKQQQIQFIKTPNQNEIETEEQEETSEYDDQEELIQEIQSVVNNMPTILTESDYSQKACQLMTTSSKLCKQMNDAIQNEISAYTSSFKLFCNIISFPRGHIYILVKPRNIYNELPGYNKQFTIEAKQQLLYKISQQVCEKISAQVSYAKPSILTVQSINFRPFADLYKNNNKNSYLLQLEKKLLNSQQVLLESTTTIESLLLINKQQAEINLNYNQIVFDGILNRINKFDSNYDQIFNQLLQSTNIVQMSSQLIVDNKPYVAASHLKLISDQQNCYTYNKIDQQVKVTVSDNQLNFATGCVSVADISKLSQADQLSIQKIKQFGYFYRLNDNNFVNNSFMSINSQFKKNSAFSYAVLPSISVNLLKINQFYQYTNNFVSPVFIKDQGINLTFNGIQAQIIEENHILRLKMPLKLFSHCSIRINRQSKSSFKFGVIIDQNQFNMIDIASGTEINNNLSLQILYRENRVIQDNDQLIIRYFYVSEQKQMTVIVTLVRQDRITNLLQFIVPNQQFMFCFTTADIQDVFTINKSRLNCLNRQFRP